MGNGNATTLRPFAVEVELVAAIPITTFYRSCMLLTSVDEISCTRTNGRLIFKGSPHEFHSYSTFMGTGFHLWHRNKRYRFMNWSPQVSSTTTGDTRVSTDIEVDLRQALTSKTVLTRLISPTAPPDVSVKSPMSIKRSMVIGVVGKLAFVAAILGVIVATSGPVSRHFALMIGGIFLVASAVVGLVYAIVFAGIFGGSSE
jgi:hypothetical protein